ncbi:hypothetical protein ACH3VR_18730 [Microbacterium sp. B2969]|uniref:Uncharacterized protein n=1 Tax=Microbacterium alkaliflavum TaxID=3248839 RepID=A0ABW7QC37_9MICO
MSDSPDRPDGEPEPPQVPQSPGPPPEGSAAPPPGTPSKAGRFPIWAGVLTGIGAFILSIIVSTAFLTAAYGANGSPWPAIGIAITFLVVPAIAIVLMIRSKNARPGSAAILVVFALGWIFLVGPCIASVSTSYV